MLEVCPSIAAATPSCEVHPLAIGARRIRAPGVRRRPGTCGDVVGLADLGFRLVASEIDTVAPDEPLPALPVARAVWTFVPTCRWRRPRWLMAGGPHHTVYSRAVDRETLDDFATIAGVELAVIHAGTSVSSFRTSWWNAVAPPRPGSVTPCPW